MLFRSAVNAAWKANATVSRVGDRYVISGMSDAAMADLVKSLALTGERVAAGGTPMKKPRIGLFEPPNSMDAGWTKWVLERYGFEFTSLNTPDITGNLKDRIDVLVVGDEARGVLPGGAGFGRAPAPTPDDDVRIKALDEIGRAHV